MVWVRVAAVAAIAALTAPALAPAAMAQGDSRKCADAEFDARSVTLGEFGPFAGASDKPSFVYTVNGPNCRIVTFYRIAPILPAGATPRERRNLAQQYVGQTAPPFFAARYVDDKPGANAYKPRWTDQDRCPALVPQLEKLEPILAPKLTGDGPYRELMMSVSDQPVLRLWMAGAVWPQTDPDYTLDISMEGGSNAPFGKWLYETFKALDTCWSAEQPKLP